MKLFLVVGFVLIVIVCLVMLYVEFYVKRKYLKLVAFKYEAVKPLIHRLTSKEAVTREDILIMVMDPAIRHAVYRTLEKYNRKDLFPNEYFTLEKGSESFLVNWLEFPTELGIAPAEIEFITKVSIGEREISDYYVFKYRTQAPHWAAFYDWMLGVSGPYHQKSEPYDVPSRVYSRFNPLNSTSVEMEVKWVHNNIHPTG